MADGETESESDREPATSDPPPEPEIEEISLSDDDLMADNGLFDDIEDADERGETVTDDPFDALSGSESALEGAITDGAARLAVVGLDADRDDLEAEFKGVFEAFRLGHFGSAFLQEYVLIDEDDAIDPAWGLAGSAVCCAAVVLWMRPDGSEQLARVTDSLGTLAGD